MESYPATLSTYVEGVRCQELRHSGGLRGATSRVRPTWVGYSAENEVVEGRLSLLPSWLAVLTLLQLDLIAEEA